MKNLPLSNSNSPALVDDDVFDALNRWTWRLDITGYPSRDGRKAGKRDHIRLHNVIIGSAPKGFVTDHANRNKLDNRRENLRFCRKSVNALNRETDFVTWSPREKSWRLRISSGGKELFCKHFASRQEAHSVGMLLKGALIYHELTKGDSHG